MNALANSKNDLPNLKNDGRMHVYLSGNHFHQNKVIIPNNNNAINIYCVYKLDPIASSRDTSFTIQNALFGAMQITKNAIDSSKNNFLIFGADMSFSVHRTNKQTIYILWVQALHKVLMILQYMQKRTFTENLQTPVKNLC